MGLFGFFFGPIKFLGKALGRLWDFGKKVWDVLSAVYNTVKSVVVNVFQGIKKAFRGVAKVIEGGLHILSGTISSLMDPYQATNSRLLAFISPRHFLTPKHFWRGGSIATQLEQGRTEQEIIADLTEALEGDLNLDEDNNGIPDFYDAIATSPDRDYLGIKFPQRLLRENDYVRYIPRIRFIASRDTQPVTMGAKGIVRSETIDNTGAYAWIKWNAYSRGEGGGEILYRANQMDLSFLGHVWDSHRVTE